MTRTWLVLLVAAFSLPAPAQVSAQTPNPSVPPDSVVYRLKPVVVTATRSERLITRVPYALGLVGQRDLQRAEIGLSLDEGLRSLPGVMVNNRYNLSQGDRITIRGVGSRTPFGVRGIKIILDRVPLTMPDGQSQLNNLDLGSAGRVEVVRGPSSSLYGNAAGGLINIQSESAPATPIQVQPQFIAGSYELQKWQAKISGEVGKQSYLVNANKLEQAGHREHSNASSVSVNAIGRHDFSTHSSLAAVLNYYDAPYLLNPSSLSREEAETAPTTTREVIKQQGAGKRIDQGQVGLTLSHGTGEANQYEATAYGFTRALFNPIPGRVIDLDRDGGGVRAVFNKLFAFDGSLLRWTIGADGEMQDDARVEFENLGIPDEQVGTLAPEDVLDAVRRGPVLLQQNEQVIGVGPFTELQWEPGRQWVATAGARYDRYWLEVQDEFLADGADDSGTRNMDQLSPMVGLLYQPYSILTTYVNYSTAFQIPTTTELSNRPSGEGGFNPDLNPETTRSIEAGAKGVWQEGHIDYDLALFHVDIDDMLISYQLEGSEEVFFRNAGKASNRGIEAELRWMPLTGLQGSVAYTFMDFRFEDFMLETDSGPMQLADNNVPGVAPHHFFAGVTYEHDSGGYAEVNWQYVGEYFANDFNGPPPSSVKPARDFVNDAYDITDVRVGWEGRYKGIRGEIFGGINNLFDVRYSASIVPNAAGDRFFEPAPGRSWYAGVNVGVSKGRPGSS